MTNLKVAVIGGGMGVAHAKAVIATHGAQLTAFCDNDAEKLAKIGRDLGVTALYTDYRDMIAAETLDAVIIASPDQAHREMIEACLDANLHIMCEKPLALTHEDVAAIVAAVEKSDRKFMVGQICRYTPGFARAKELIEHGAIGELTFVESEYAHDYVSVFARKNGNWRCDPLRSGVVGGGCHAVDLLRWIAGDPTDISAYGVHKTFADVTPYDDTHIAIMRFPGGVIGKVFVSISCKRDYTMRSVFYGTRGTIICDNRSPEITLFRQELVPNEDNHALPVKIPVDINNHNAEGEFREFYDIIVNDKPVRTTVQEGANTIEACLAIMESAETGKTVTPVYFG